jgi:hypothetical protein
MIQVSAPRSSLRAKRSNLVRRRRSGRDRRCAHARTVHWHRAPGKESGVREAKGLFIVKSEFLRTVPVLPRDPRYPDKISDAAKNHLADVCCYGLRFDLPPAFSTRRRWVV